MDFFSMNSGYYDLVYSDPYDYDRHRGFGHELLGGAAAFAAFKLYERRQQENGNPIRHAGAKSALAALAGFEITKLFEDNRYRHIDMDMARMHAEQQCAMMYEQQYGGGMDMGMDPYAISGGYGGGTYENIQEVTYDQGSLYSGGTEQITNVNIDQSFGPYGRQENIQQVDIDQYGPYGERREEITDIRYNQEGYGGGFNDENGRW